MPTLLGLPSCDTCRRAKKALEAKGLDVSFRDVREDPLSEAELAKYLQLFGDALLNTRSTTWRGLSEDDRKASPSTLLQAYPALMKRPVIDGPEGVTLGWSKDVQARYLG